MSFLGVHDGYAVIYKPEAGMRPLHDFEAVTLPGRELAAYELSRRTGADCVPHTDYVEAEHGPGSAQRWCGVSGEYVTEAQLEAELDTLGDVDDGMFPEPGAGLFEVAETPAGLVITHDLGSGLRRLALFDLVTNNADRKIGHVLKGPGGRVVGIDNGLTFHEQNKLRTVLWGFAGTPFDDSDRAYLTRCGGVLREAGFRESVRGVSAAEFDSAGERCEALLRGGTFPHPRGDYRDYPWPPW